MAEKWPATDHPGGERLQRFVRYLADPRFAIIVLIISTALHRFRFYYFSATWRPEHLAILYVAAVLLLKVGSQNWRIAFARDDIPLFLYFALALISSYLNAPVFFESLKFFGLMVSCYVIYWLVRNIVVDVKLFRTAVITFAVLGSIQAAIGILTWLLYLFGIDLGIVLYPLESGNRSRLCTFSPVGTFVEPNIFGAYVMGTCVLLMFLFTSQGVRLRTVALAGITLMLVAVAVSLTRTAWVALAVGTVLVMSFAKNNWRLKAYILPGLIVGALAAYVVSNVRIPCVFIFQKDRTVAAVPLPNREYLSPKPKISKLVNDRIFARYTVFTRFKTYRGVLEDWFNHPWIGNGVNTFGQRHRTTSFTPAWISNVELMALHDTGLFGLLILLFWAVWLLRDLARVLRRRSAFPFTRIGLSALAVAFSALLVAYQLTTAFWLGFTWIYLGLIRAGITILEKEPAPIETQSKLNVSPTAGHFEE